MTRLTQEEIQETNRLIGINDINTPEILSLIGYYNWDRFGITEVNRLFPDTRTVQELIDKLIVVGITPANFSPMMMNYHQAHAWFMAHDSVHQYENQTIDLSLPEEIPTPEPKP